MYETYRVISRGSGKSHGWLDGDILVEEEEGEWERSVAADCNKIMRMWPRVASFCLMKDSTSPPVDSRALTTRNANVA